MDKIEFYSIANDKMNETFVHYAAYETIKKCMRSVNCHYAVHLCEVCVRGGGGRMVSRANKRESTTSIGLVL